MTRLCYNCRTHIPPDTEHYNVDGDERNILYDAG